MAKMNKAGTLVMTPVTVKCNYLGLLNWRLTVFTNKYFVLVKSSFDSAPQILTYVPLQYYDFFMLKCIIIVRTPFSVLETFFPLQRIA